VPSSPAKVRQVGALLALATGGAAATAQMTVSSEGWENIGYPDVVYGMALATSCAGSTRNVIVGKYYDDDECMGRTASDLIQTGLAISKCLPWQAIPVPTYGSFMDMAYNVGPPKFCASSIADAARRGDLRTACARINTKPDGRPQWIYAVKAGVPIPLPGLITRRAAERKLCESGLQGSSHA
jgi:lysozyme